jgi:hypothetical protein
MYFGIPETEYRLTAPSSGQTKQLVHVVAASLCTTALALYYFSRYAEKNLIFEQNFIWSRLNYFIYYSRNYTERERTILIAAQTTGMPRWIRIRQLGVIYSQCCKQHETAFALHRPDAGIGK